MKKYIKPNTEVISVKTQQMIANSITSITGLTGVDVGGEFTGGTVDTRAFDFVFDGDTFDFKDETISLDI